MLISYNSDYSVNVRLERFSSDALNPEEKERNDKNFMSNNTKGQYDNTVSVFTDGDRLKLTGHSSIYKTIVMAEPVSDTTITFDFVECKDGDSNYYTVVRIGSQIWMAENLRKVSLTTGEEIPYRSFIGPRAFVIVHESGF